MCAALTAYICASLNTPSDIPYRDLVCSPQVTPSSFYWS